MRSKLLFLTLILFTLIETSAHSQCSSPWNQAGYSAWQPYANNGYYPITHGAPRTPNDAYAQAYWCDYYARSPLQARSYNDAAPYASVRPALNSGYGQYPTTGYQPYAPGYPLPPSPGSYGPYCPQGDGEHYLGYGFFGQPRAFGRDEPIRNFSVTSCHSRQLPRGRVVTHVTMVMELRAKRRVPGPRKRLWPESRDIAFNEWAQSPEKLCHASPPNFRSALASSASL
jgi:hypothetical protein